MAIQPKCDKCGRELNEFGAILLSPPNDEGQVRKFHFCQPCYELIISDIETTDELAQDT